MYPTLLLFLFLASGQSLPPSQMPMLDGETSSWTEQSASYTFKCAGGTSAELVFTQTRGGSPVLAKFAYSGKLVVRPPADALAKALEDFRTVESVSPRCVNGGGAQVLVGGLGRSKPAKRRVFMLKVDKTGKLSIVP